MFVQGAVPGDTIRAQVRKKKKNLAEANTIKILKKSPHRVDPECRHFGTCGGCKAQDFEYGEQLAWKRQVVADAFTRIGKFENVLVHETLPSPEVFYYRNKMEFSFGRHRWLFPDELGTVDREQEQFALGLHIPKRYDRILSIDDCRLQSPESTAILNASREYFLANDATVYSSDDGTGTLRHLVIREGKNTGQRMVFLVTFDDPPGLIEGFSELLQKEEFGVTTFIHGITKSRSTVAVAEKEKVYFGPGIIEETLGAFRFQISPTSFFQTNSYQAKQLYDVACDYAAFQPTDTVWDFYCGTGTITLYISDRVKSTLGVELNEYAIENARVNAKLNDVENAEFVSSDIAKFVRKGEAEKHPSPDVIIVDPPRPGLHPSVVEAIGNLGVERVVYVSCNPSSCARDCEMLSEYGYRIEEIQPVDMFPHTYHIECVVKLRK